MMSTPSALALIAVLTFPIVAQAQHGGAPLDGSPPKEASQYDFLIGQWDLVVKVPAQGLAQRIHGSPQLRGTWKAWRAFDGWGVEDELRITDAAGNPLALSVAMRVYDASARHWASSSIDIYRARFTTATNEWKDGEMAGTSQGTELDGRPFLQRSRIYDITATGFRMQQDRSYDDGKTWSEGTLKIEAKRVAATAPR
jgi:hypothetical protein